jgi:uncharacterized membrane protein
VKIYLETNKKTGKVSSLIDNKGYAIAIAVVLIVVSSLLIGYYFVSTLPPEGYTTIYMLDNQHKAIDYPELLVVNENSTFNVWIVVEDRMGRSQSSEVLQKVVGDMIPSFPVDVDAQRSYERTVENGGTWETLATVSINERGSYSVIFELWIYDDKTGIFEFSYNYCVLNVEVITQH